MNDIRHVNRMIYPAAQEAFFARNPATGATVPVPLNYVDARLLNRHHRRRLAKALFPRWKDKLLARVKFLRGVEKHGV